ncbi:MAG: hypothetical protein ACI920_001618, partial [Saprospiraceae bacterium]
PPHKKGIIPIIISVGRVNVAKPMHNPMPMLYLKLEYLYHFIVL